MQNKPPQGSQTVVMSKTKTMTMKTKKDSKWSWDWKDYFSFNGRLTLIIPYIIGAAIFIITPMVMLLTKAVSHQDGIDAQAIVKEADTWHKIGNSIYLGLIAAAISLLIAFPFSFVVARSSSKAFRIISISLLISPMLVFTVARIFSLRILLVKMYDDPVAMQNKLSMIIGMVYLYMPFMIIPLYSVLQQMPKSLFEASKDLGYNAFTTVFRVVVPYSLKAVFSGIAVVFMMSSTSLVISGSLIGSDNKELMMIGNKIDGLAVKMNQSPVYATQGSVLALVTIAVVMAVYGGVYLFPIIIRKLRGGVNV